MHNSSGARGIAIQGGDRQTQHIHSDSSLLDRIQQIIDAHVMTTGKQKSRVLTYVIDELAKSKRHLDDSPANEHTNTPTG